MKWLSKIRRSLPLLVLVFVLGYSLVYACAWVQLYFRIHTYRTASEWIFENIPQGSVLAAPHWDDRLPLSVSGKEAPRYYTMEGKQIELPLYERDTKEKLNLVLRVMAKADYIVFPTARISDSIPRVPEEFPYTAPLLQLLWSEKLGFTFEKAIKDRPSFLGFTFNDDLADESFSVYDHPKVVIFKNAERLTEEQMRERVVNAKRYEPLPTLNEILLMDQAGWAKTATVHDPNPGRLAATFAFLMLLGFATWIVIAPAFFFLPDRGLGLSFLGGIVLSGGLTWVAAFLKIVPFTATSGLFFVALILLTAVVRLCSSRQVRQRCGEVVSRYGTGVLLSVFAGVVVVVVTKRLYPSYFWGAGEFERFALAFFSRNEMIPPSVGWRQGIDGGSFYGAYLLAGWLAKVVGASGAFAYELCFVMLGGAVGGLLCSIVTAFCRRTIQSTFITLLLLIPVIRGVHVVFHGYTGLDEAQAQASLKPSQERLVEWLLENVKGAPLVVEACDQGQSPGISVKVGLPTLSGDAAQTICSLGDPEGVFKAMMAHKVSLLIITGQDESVSPARKELLTKLAARPEFFVPIYSDEGSLVVAPAFSEYFPRAYQKRDDPQ